MTFKNRIPRQAVVWSLLFFTLFCSRLGLAQQPADNEYQVGAILWTQSSAEKAALSYQAFNLARMMLDRDLQTNRNRRMRRAVIVDVDETVLDNSRYQGMDQTHKLRVEVVD